MNDIITAILLLFGATFMLLASLGTLRLPDLFTRMHAATKSGTLGVSGMILALGIHFNDLGVGIRAVLVVIFVFMTAPVAAHVIARAAYIVGVPLWDRTITDELRGRYHPQTNALDGLSEEERQQFTGDSKDIDL